MLNTTPTADETTRLATIRELDLLNPDQNQRFDPITRVAAALLNVPYAMINIISADKEVNKSCFGMSPGVAKDRSSCFCSYTILSDEPFIIENAPLDKRVQDYHDVKEGMNIRAYAGMPLTAPDGTHPGALCIIDLKPRNFTQTDILLLRDLAKWAELECRTNF